MAFCILVHILGGADDIRKDKLCCCAKAKLILCRSFTVINHLTAGEASAPDLETRKLGCKNAGVVATVERELSKAARPGAAEVEGLTDYRDT